MKFRKTRRVDKGVPNWMVTYADMVTLVLVFFILLFSMSQIDLVKFQATSESFRNRMIFDYYPSPIPLDHPTEHTEVQEKEEGSLDYKNALEESNENQTEYNQVDSLGNILEEVQKFLDENQLNNVISASRTERGVVLLLREKVLFQSARADILDSAKPFLDKVGTLLSNFPNQVRVEGHTDSRPIANYRYPSNWELSTARASSVIRYVLDNSNLDDSRFIAVGYSDTKPVADNNSAENMSKNRRVEFVILEQDENNAS